MSETRISVVIPNKDGAGIVGRCVAAAIASGADEVIVVDDGSADESPAEAEQARAIVLRSPGAGFAAAVNEGVRHAGGEVLLVLNSDCFLEADAAERLVDALAADPDIGICGASLLETDGTPSKSHVPALTLGLAVKTVLRLNPLTPRKPGRGVQELECIPLACAAIRRSTWQEIGGLDERFFFYFEDQDLCRRLRAGGAKVAVNWDAVAVHIGGAGTARKEEQKWFLQLMRSRSRYLHKHYPRTWPVFAVVWVPTAAARALVWSVRRGPSASAWARAWRAAILAGVRG